MKLFEIIEIFNDPPLMEMANLFKTDTGMEYPIWIGRVGGQHGPRVKVSNIVGKWRFNDNFVMDVSENPTVLTPNTCKISKASIDKIRNWIIINYDDLMVLWWMFERHAATVKDEDTGMVLSYDDIIDRLHKV